jgi:hypothetical protein
MSAELEADVKYWRDLAVMRGTVLNIMEAK